MADYLNQFLVCDTETGGLPSKLKKEATTEVALTEIAFVVVDNSSLEIIDKVSWLIKPYSDDLIYDPFAAQVSGISKELCEKEGLPIEQVFKEVVSFINSHKVKSKKPVMVLQNKKFDIPFIENLFKLHKKDLWKYIDPIVEDTMFWSRRKWSKEGKHSLAEISKRLNFDNTQSHRALPDTIVTAQVWIDFLKSLRDMNVPSTNKEEVKEKKSFKF